MRADAGMGPGDLALDFAGERLHLLPERALWWPQARCLFVADVHLGKAASFRAAGQPVPSGTTADNLRRLDQLLQRLPAQRLVVLGDFLHARAAQQAALMQPLRQWRARHPALAIALVRGNHDEHAGDPPADLGLQIVDEPHALGPLRACHHPQLLPGLGVLCGHVHPAVRLQGPGRERLRLPCFALRPFTAEQGGLLLLPAFGAFTGASLRPLPPGLRRYAVGADRVWALDGR